MVSVHGNTVNLRSGPGSHFPVRWEYGNGFPLKVLSTKQNWLKVRDFEDDTGWIYKPLVDDTPHVIVNVNKNSKVKINIRSSPSIHSKVLGKAFYGVVFKVITEKDGWVKVHHEGGLNGWIKKSLLWGF